MKTSLLTAVLAICCVYNGASQTISESTQPLTKQAQKGYIDDVLFEEDGSVHVIYQFRINKKADEISYEDYMFDRNLKFLEKKNTSVAKETRPDKETRRLGAYVGACSSFDILSMKLRVTTDNVKLTDWNYKKQRYDRVKVIDSETVKLKNEGGKSYFGIANFWPDDFSYMVVLAYYETKDKSNPKKYVLLTIDFDGNVKEKPLDISGNFSLVYTQEISEGSQGDNIGNQDIIVLLAPKAGSSNISEYVYLRYAINGMLKNKITFPSPSTNLLVTNAIVNNESVYLFGQSTNSKKAFSEIFEDYAPLPNPCYKDAENYQMFKYYKAADESMDNFHMIKFTGDKIDFASSTPIATMKGKVKTPPSQKGNAPAFQAKKFAISQFTVTPAGEYLITGQRVSTAIINANIVSTYGDIVCLHLDAQGNFKSQYAVDKMFESKNSKLWMMNQTFYFTPDGKDVYWEILEIKGERDFWTGAVEMPEYYPRITKINLENTTISDFKVFGNKKYFVYKSFPRMFLPEQNCVLYFGKDEDESVLWVGKAILN